MYQHICRTRIVTLAFYFACVMPLVVTSAAPCYADVLKIVVDDTIHPLIAEHIDRAVKEAQRTHADALLIELRTPGGLLDSTRQIIQTILASPVPVVIYVTPAGSNAASAGFFILESSDVAAMAPGTNTGAAHPVISGGTLDPIMKEKLENDAAALMRSYSGKRGRNSGVAESAVRQSKSFSADEALSQHLIDYIAKDETDLFRQMDGKSVTRFDGSKITLHLASGTAIRLYEMTLKEKILSWLMDPNFTVILLLIGMMAIYAEFNHPGAVIPGVVGFVAILLALFALRLLPTRYEALVLILGAFVLFALEAKFQTHGALAAGGIALMFLGALLLVDGPVPEMRVKWWTALSVSVPLGAITVFLMTIALRARRNKITTGQEGLVGEVGIVRAPLSPSGKVFVHGELWDAVSSMTVDTGQAVVVRKVQNLVLHVEPAPLL